MKRIKKYAIIISATIYIAKFELTQITYILFKFKNETSC